MNRSFAIFVTLIFALQLCGFYTYFFFKNIQLHANALERLEKVTKAETITLSARTFEASLVEENEIKIGSQIFDIKKVISNSDSVTVTIIRDVEEEVLIEFLSDLISNSTKQTNENIPSQVTQVFQLVFLPSHFSFSAIDILTSTNFSIRLSTNPIGPESMLITPPPRA